MGRAPSRRAVLAGTLALAAAPAVGRAGGGPPRLAALDWNLAVTATDLGVPPAAVAEQALYRDWVGEPALAPGTIELGLRLTPGLEMLASLAPDLILVNPLNEALRPRLERIASTFMDTTFTGAHAPLTGSRSTTRALAGRLGRTGAAEALIADADRRLAQARAKLTPWRGRPISPASLVDNRHLTFYGAGSLFGDVLDALGLPRGFDGPTGTWGTATRSLATLAETPPADLIVLAPVPPEAERLLSDGGLLRRLLAARDSALIVLPPVWPFGGLSAAVRFAELLAERLPGRAPAPQRRAGARRPCRTARA